jgi:hypothetical protein
MRRIVLTVLACGAVLAVGASAALADHHDGRHERRHELRDRHEARDRRHEVRHRRHEARHRTRIHHERWGTDDATKSTAGTVASFTNGILTIRLSDNSMVSGTVTSTTEIECEAAEGTAMQADDRDGGDDHGGDNGGDRGDPGDPGDPGDNGNDEGQTCGTGALMAGTAVHEAELRLSSAGAHWDKVELIVQGAAETDS